MKLYNQQGWLPVMHTLISFLLALRLHTSTPIAVWQVLNLEVTPKTMARA